MSINPVATAYYEIEELAAIMLGKYEDYEEGNTDELEEDFYDKFECDLTALGKIVSYLLPLIEKQVSPLSGTMQQGFGYNGCYIVKVQNDNL